MCFCPFKRGIMQGCSFKFNLNLNRLVIHENCFKLSEAIPLSFAAIMDTFNHKRGFKELLIVQCTV